MKDKKREVSLKAKVMALVLIGFLLFGTVSGVLMYILSNGHVH